MAFLALALASEGVILSHTLAPGPDVFLAAVLRSDVILFTEEARASEGGGGALIENDALDAAAQAKAEDMAAKGYFSHVGPGGEEPWEWLERAGYEYAYAGENLAVRFEDSKDVVDAWMASPAHRANIVKPQYREIGVGIAEGTYKGGPATFVVQYFGSPARAAAASPEPSEAQAADASGAAPETAASEAPAPAPSAVAGAETQTLAAAEEPPAPAPVQAQPDAAPEPRLQPHSAPADSTAERAERIADALGSGAPWVLAGVAALLALVIALTFFVRIQVQPTDLLLPGLAVALIALTFIAANATLLPGASQSASVANFSPGDIAGGISTERATPPREAPIAEPSL